MKILVTGGRGFIGTHLVNRLQQLKHEVSISEKDDRPVLALTEDDMNVDFIFHLAATPRVGISLEQPKEVIENNTMTTLHLLEHCRKNPRTKLIFISSSSVRFANVNLNPYALSKKMGEDMVNTYRDSFGVAATSARLFNVYGPGEANYGPYTTLVKRCKNQFNAGLPLQIQGDGSIIRDFTHVEDAVEGLISIMTLMSKTKRIYRAMYEIGGEPDGGIFTVADIVYAFKAGHPHVEIEFVPGRPGDPPSTRAQPFMSPPMQHRHNIISYIQEWKAMGCPDD